MNLPIRPNNNPHFITASIQSQELQIDEERQSGGIPWLHGVCGTTAPQALTLMLRVYNKSGILIIDGQSRLEAGQQHFTFQELRPLGIEAYAHASEAERVQIGQRVWSRAVYGMLTIL